MSAMMIELPPEWDARLESVAARRQVAKEAVAREMITSCLKDQLAEIDSTVRTGSVLDLVRDLVGKFEGPADLSTNPKYMEGFGK